jgi:hypothetical protein
MPTLRDFATQLSINPDKPFFPVNSLRLLYFLIGDFYTGTNVDVATDVRAEAREKIGSLIPKVEAVFAMRAQHRGNVATATAQSDLEACWPVIQDVYSVIDTPVVRQVFNQLFSYLYPLQDELFLNIYQEVMSDKALNAQHLSVLLQVRAADSLIFSTLLSEIIGQTRNSRSPAADNSRELENQTSALQPLIHHHIHLAYQINDLVDAIVFAKDDLENNNFSPFQVVRKIAPESANAKELIKNTLAGLREKAAVFPFPEPLQQEVNMFYNELVGVVHGE